MSRRYFLPNWTGTRHIWRLEPAHQPWAERVRIVCDTLNTEGKPVHQYALMSMLVEVPAGARSTDPDTSHIAAAMPRDIAGNHRLVLQLLADHGPMTDWDLSQQAARRGINIVPTSIGKRRQELTTVGYVCNSGRRRQTGTGATAICWQITSSGKQALTA